MFKSRQGNVGFFVAKIPAGIAAVLCGCFLKQSHRVSCKHIKNVYQGVYQFQLSR